MPSLATSPPETRPTGPHPSGPEAIGRPQLTLRDPVRLLRRVARHVRLRPHHLVSALVSIGRQYVVGAVGIPLDVDGRPPSDGDPSRGNTVDSAVPRAARPGHALVVVHCRPGRVVWLPADLERFERIIRLAELRGIRAADQLLLTEHGWRTLPGNEAGSAPALRLTRPGATPR